jgi:hypothetical protein
VHYFFVDMDELQDSEMAYRRTHKYKETIQKISPYRETSEELEEYKEMGTLYRDTMCIINKGTGYQWGDISNVSRRDIPRTTTIRRIEEIECWYILGY